MKRRAAIRRANVSCSSCPGLLCRSGIAAALESSLELRALGGAVAADSLSRAGAGRGFLSLQRNLLAGQPPAPADEPRYQREIILRELPGFVSDQREDSKNPFARHQRHTNSRARGGFIFPGPAQPARVADGVEQQGCLAMFNHPPR